MALPAKTIAEFFNTLSFQDPEPRYNIAPTQPILAIWADRDIDRPAPFWAHWGLIPFWAKDEKIGQKLSNARGETLTEKPSFRAAYKYRRCIIPVQGFYEWKREDGVKQPYYFKLANEDPIPFAGLWEHWSGPQGEEILSATIITTKANQLMAPIHHRMPAILKPDQFQAWLDPQEQRGETFNDWLIPYEDEHDMICYPVSRRVNNARHEGSDLIRPQDSEPAQDQLPL